MSQGLLTFPVIPAKAVTQRVHNKANMPVAMDFLGSRFCRNDGVIFKMSTRPSTRAYPLCHCEERSDVAISLG